MLIIPAVDFTDRKIFFNQDAGVAQVILQLHPVTLQAVIACQPECGGGGRLIEGARIQGIALNQQLSASDPGDN